MTTFSHFPNRRSINDFSVLPAEVIANILSIFFEY
jgi:hypothetical protein